MNSVLFSKQSCITNFVLINIYLDHKKTKQVYNLIQKLSVFNFMWRLYVTVQSYLCRMQNYQCRKNELVLALQIFKATQVRICFIATLVHAKFLQQNCLPDDLVLNGRILIVTIFHESYIIPIVKKIQLIYFSFRNKFCGSRKVGYGFFI